MKENRYRVDWEVIEEIVVLHRSQGGWAKELNLISWNGDNPKFDVRWWNPDKTRVGKGFTFTKEELKILYDTLPEALHI
ncbi:seryl-tRNA synthetase [Oceanobacillus picturae]|uniref:Seryl-tRNA synthetase n=1 Tax=Oceanobacillus picturae TaxID=171693 RepID=A0A0U9H7U6_9BACI|nr:PC4/YdbC family ssDNA-binding protein [Oceanobacillus picturae]GAQ18443.1 seryl-tRNA synthetase [Oceanobacillus picturae]